MIPRYYQTEATDSLFNYWEEGNDGNPLIVLPTGSGKSLTLAMAIRRCCELYDARVILATHQKELIEQDTTAIVKHWPNAPIGIWSASVGMKKKNQVTVAGIQSIHTHPTYFAGTDLVFIDEAHLLSKRADTMYGRFIDGLRSHNKYLKVVGFTATPYRLDSGLLTEGKDRVFTDIAYEIDVGTLIKQGYLCPLITPPKAMKTKANLEGLHTRGGEFIDKELQDAMDKAPLIHGALAEVEEHAASRKHILGFCAGIEHAAHCAEVARARGHTAAYIDGSMAKGTREKILADFQAGKYRFLFNAMVLTTGFDFPGIDCIMMLRPTQSVGLYVQILGRGLRNVYAFGYDLETEYGRLAAIANGPKPNCLVLDFAGNLQRHGPIDQIRVKSKREKDEDAISVAPMKECPMCQELVHASVMVCPSCEHEWESAQPHGVEASTGVVVAALREPEWVPVTRVEYVKHVKLGRPPSLQVTYWSGINEHYKEWIPIEDERDFVRKHSVMWFWKRGMMPVATVDEALNLIDQGKVPDPVEVLVKPDGKYMRIVDSRMRYQ